MLFSLLMLLAQAQDAAPKGDPNGGGPAGFLSSPLFPMILIFGAMYLFILLPAQRREHRQRESLFSTLKKNDEVVTSSGIIGVVQMIKEGDEIVLKIDDNAKLRVLKSSITRIIPKDAPAATPPA